LIIIFYDLAYIKIVRARILSRSTKLKLQPILTYGPEAWAMTMEETNALRMFERKVVKKRYEHGKTTRKGHKRKIL
jgi:hypothetical protein